MSIETIDLCASVESPSVGKIRPSWLSILLLAWLGVFFLGPLTVVVITSFLKRGLYGGVEWTFNLSNYLRILDTVYFHIFLRSLSLAFLSALFCAVLAIPIAWSLSTASSRFKALGLGLIAMPFVINLIVRIYSIKLFFSFEGPFVWASQFFGFNVDPFSLSQNQFLVFYGMVTTYLPFMVFPLFAAFEKFQWEQVEAVYDLGGGPLRALTKVILPQIKPALASGTLMVFVPALGEYLIPDLLGGAKNMLMGNLVTDQFLKSRDWPFGSALTVSMILFMFLTSWLLVRWSQRES